MNHLHTLWLVLIGSLWFVPMVLVLASVVAALALIELEPMLRHDLTREWPRLFGAGAQASRDMLAAIATSMITVAGVVFSVTIVALSLTASQYSPRVLRTFMSDRPTQFVLGTFVAVFAYCLVVLRTIRGSDDGGFVPSMAVLGGVLMAFVGIGVLIYFVHHLASAIQVPFIVGRIASDAASAIDRMYPVPESIDRPADSPGEGRPPCPGHGTTVPSNDTGYLVSIDTDRLVDLAAEVDTVLRVKPRVGDFAVEGTPIVEVASYAICPSESWRQAVQGCLSVQAERDVDEDPAYGLELLVDVAMKALSPSVHDPTTATTCVDQLGALLQRLSGRHVPGPMHERDGRLRVIVPVPAYEDYVRLALSAVTHHAGSHDTVHARLIAAVEGAADATLGRRRLAVLVHRLDIHLERLPQSGLADEDVQRLLRDAGALRDRLRKRLQASLPMRP